MDRRRAILALASCSGALAVAPALSQPAKPRRIGLLSPLGQGDPQTQSRLAAFEQELGRLGWKKGADVLLDYRFADGHATRAGQLAKELLDLHPEVVVAFGTSSAAALRQQTLSIPIVFAQVVDPVAAGFVTNLARPEGNITGFTQFDSSIGEKWLQAIKECAPKVNRVALVFDPTNPAWTAHVRAVESAAKKFAVKLVPVSAKDAADLEKQITSFAASPNGALVIVPGAVTTTHSKVIVSLAARHRLPAVYPYSFHTANGGLMSYGVDLLSLYRGAASYVDRILKGAKPSDLPIQQPTRFELTVNLKTARALGITVPQSLLQQADKVIQ
ncbi:MAG TPA: ABC transporter substrate-binding protein [Burkholderiales bacterium]|jgi:putative ABC transport system substrate-binding protein